MKLYQKSQNITVNHRMQTLELEEGDLQKGYELVKLG